MTGEPLCTRESQRNNLKFGMEHSQTYRGGVCSNPNIEGSMLIYTGNIGSKLAPTLELREPSLTRSSDTRE